MGSFVLLGSYLPAPCSGTVPYLAQRLVNRRAFSVLPRRQHLNPPIAATTLPCSRSGLRFQQVARLWVTIPPLHPAEG
ncbi:hypothetical protein Q31a_15660 [Aureliella helgolandensis]|uniref:Uncharacterized protein n=1 Tax=Aureliella helgolandensis TaxID=2527968 RepID=A0A518G3T7_9BACT|nr:hypothetical protein Q31a_15660 [Aureliella helgolandensis]